MVAQVQPFVAWFTAHNGHIDTDKIDIVELPQEEGVRGVVALQDIPEGHAVFAIPRTLVLSTRTSALRARFGPAAWWARGLHEGWSGLILCMMWEAAQGPASTWAPYFDILPTTFDTPMFWSDADLAELQGTAVVEKLGRDQAEKDYNEKVRPAIESRPDLFAPADIDTRYSLACFHLQGSRILSRSFTLQKDRDYEEDGPGADADDDADAEVGNTSVGSAMDVDTPRGAKAEALGHAPHGDEEHGHGHGEEGEGSDSIDDDDDEDPGFVAMVPFADMLNARYQSENVRLFYESDCLKMISTKPIKAGEQIWNTYQDLPNSELLRGFGHVDYLPLPGGGFGNPGDVAELRADLLVQALGGADAKADMEERIDWWLEEGGDDVFVLELPPSLEETEFPPDLLAFTQLLAVDAEWERAREKDRMPKPAPGRAGWAALHVALTTRLALYATTLEDDRALEERMGALSVNGRHALVVRMGEKRVVEAFRAKAAAMVLAAEGGVGGRGGKRKAEGEGEGADGAGGKRKKGLCE